MRFVVLFLAMVPTYAEDGAAPPLDTGSPVEDLREEVRQIEARADALLELLTEDLPEDHLEDATSSWTTPSVLEVPESLVDPEEPPPAPSPLEPEGPVLELTVQDG